MSYIRKKGNRWYFTIEIGEGGKRKRKELAGGKTKAEAEAAYARALVDLQVNGAYIEPTKKTLNEFASEFFTDNSRNVHANTIKSYQSIYRNHIAPIIGEHKLRTIKPRTLQNLLNQKKEAGLARSTVSSIYTVLKRLFVYAADFCEYIPKNPAQNIHLPKYTQPPRTVLSFSPQQVAEIFRRFPKGHQFFLPLAISYYTGARFGECCALTWQDVDFDTREISITRTVVEMSGGLTVQDVPKTSSSFRIIPCGKKLINILRAEKALQAAARLAGSGYADNFIIHDKHGKLMGPNAIRYFNMYIKKYGNGYSVHSMRHTHATMLLEAGEELELVSKRLGHASIDITAKTYSHVLEARKNKSRRLIDEIL